MSKFKAQNKSKIQISKQKMFCHLLFVLCAYFGFCALVFGFLSGCQNQQLYTDNRVMMGTVIEVTSPYKQAAGIVFNEMKRIEGLLSKYKPDSEVSKLNCFGKLNVSPDTFFIIKESKEFWQISNGAFDISVGPLMDLWGFTDRKYSLPKEEEIKNTLGLIGSDKIILQDSDNVVKFKISGMKIDLGAIAKGYALDCVVDKLRKAGIKSCLINAGGQVYCLGDKFGKPWKIAIKDPREKNIVGYLELKDKSVSTSGDYEQFFIKDKRRYAHIFNPKTGYPANSGVVSVTVIASDGLTADALSTAIFVLGKEKSRELIKRFPDIEVKIIEEKDVRNNG
jgi:thiamine biosynthesis lipoprotein